MCMQMVENVLYNVHDEFNPTNSILSNVTVTPLIFSLPFPPSAECTYTKCDEEILIIYVLKFVSATFTAASD